MILLVVVYAILFTPTLYITTVLITCILTIVTLLRARLHEKNDNHSKPCWSSFQTSLYTGHVSHVRFQPKVHSFTYPIFFFLIDLSESYSLFQKSYSTLWPLNLLMQLKDCDHLKNGEGLFSEEKEASNNNNNNIKNNNNNTSTNNSLATRIQRLVAERTQGKYIINSKTQPILLLTHLSYFGYCFNPVSFYYILKSKEDPTIDVMVAEVSNTPWLEMKCYVLHPDSIDMLTQEGSSFQRQDKNQNLHYIFPKKFHVSPFMEMDYMYDWIFSNQPIIVTKTLSAGDNNITVSTSMKQKSTGIQYFNAFLQLKRQSLYPMKLAIQLCILPFFCIIIQLWIHWEALRLMYKGIVFIPHPQGTTTRSSRIIEVLVQPFVFLYHKFFNSAIEDKKD